MEIVDFYINGYDLIRVLSFEREVASNISINIIQIKVSVCKFGRIRLTGSGDNWTKISIMYWNNKIHIFLV